METFLIETRSGWSFSLGCWDWVIFIIKLYWEILTLSRLDKSKVSTYWEISIEKYAKKSVHDQDYDKQLRITKISRSRQISLSRSRLLGLEVGVNTISRLTFEQCWDRDSRSRPRRDKLRPPSHFISFPSFQSHFMYCVPQ